MTPALKKLRYKPGMRVGVVGAPSGFERQVIAAKEITRAPARAKNLDLVQAFFTRQAHFVRDLPRLTKTLADGGILWVCYPKAGALGTDLHRDIVRDLAAEAGWETVAAVAVDDVWSALRLKPTA
jgi:hypothetical protein